MFCYCHLHIYNEVSRNGWWKSFATADECETLMNSSFLGRVIIFFHGPAVVKLQTELIRGLVVFKPFCFTISPILLWKVILLFSLFVFSRPLFQYEWRRRQVRDYLRRFKLESKNYPFTLPSPRLSFNVFSRWIHSHSLNTSVFGLVWFSLRDPP